MFARTRYIDWALRFYGKVPYDLATSGIPHVAWSDLEVPLPELDDPTGVPKLRESIARYNLVDVDEVLPALGASGALFMAYAALLEEGDEVVVESPGYEPLTRAAQGLGARVRTFERRADEGFRVVPERVAAAVTPRTRAIAVTNLHNPSGARVDDATLRELALVAEARGAHLVVDEVYAPFDALADGGVFHGCARRLAPNVVSVGSLTKCYGLGMHRIGWLLAPEGIVERAQAAVIATYGHLALPHANLGAAAFAALPALSRRARALAAGKRAIAEAWVGEHASARWSAPREGIFGLVTVPGAGDLLPLIERLATDDGVLVAAGSFFGVPDGFRLSWASCDEARFTAALDRLAPLLDAG
jgi:aspartate/methionine/tyrosine aminotransferase